MLNLSKVSLVKRLSFFQTTVILVLMGTFSVALSTLITRRLEKRTEDDLQQRVLLLVSMISTYHSALAQNANTLNSVFLASFPGTFSLDSGTQVQVGDRKAPLLKSGTTVVDGNTALMDHFHDSTHALCSVFVRSGDDFIRVATSVRDDKGNRVTGSLLDRTNPAYAALIGGGSFTGKATTAGRDTMSSYAPIKDANGNVVAVVAIAVDFTAGVTSLTEQVLRIKIGKTGYIFALDAKPGKEQGVARIHPTKAGQNILDIKDSNGFAFIRDMIDRKQGVTQYPWINTALNETKPREKIVAFAYLRDWDWVIAAGSYQDELNAEGAFLRNTMLGATLLVVLVLVSMSVLMMRRWISQPLQRAVLVTDRLASGDFTQVSNFQIDEQATENEVEQLERGIYRMAHSLCGLLRNVHEAASQLTASSMEISASASRSSETSENQSQKTSMVATAMLEMSATVEEVSRHSQQAAETARIAADTAREGGTVVSETLASMRAIATSTGLVSARISDLGQSSSKIGAIASVIADIAGQTNLLALNAAIEAARAGEQGRGFAVVAGEVRRLAERTAMATQEITGMIGNIQREAREAVEAMQGETQHVTFGVAKTESSGHALDRIIEMAGRVGDMVTQIAGAATEQSAAAEEVNGNVAHIAQMTTESAQNASETAKACTGLTHLALSMQSVVDQFKLEN